MGRRYTYSPSNVWEWTRQRNFRFACCDCGLVHVLDFKIEHTPFFAKLFMKARRDNRATGQIRRWDRAKKKRAINDVPRSSKRRRLP